MPEIKSIRQYSSNRWLVQYSELAACGCYWKRRILWMKQQKKPTKNKILNEINNQQQKLRVAMGIGSD